MRLASLRLVRKVAISFVGLGVAGAAVVAGWMLLYPSPQDPKNIGYVLWKAGVWTLTPEQAASIMIGDVDRDKLVIGKHRVQIEKRFGPLVEPGDASPYSKRCYQESPWKAKRVLFIADSPWMVVFEGDIASDLVLVKGC